MTKLKIYQSTGENELFVEQTLEQLTPIASDETVTTVNLDENQTFQEMDGFGASFTDSSAYLINQVLDNEQKKKS